MEEFAYTNYRVKKELEEFDEQAAGLTIWFSKCTIIHTDFKTNTLSQDSAGLPQYAYADITLNETSTNAKRKVRLPHYNAWIGDFVVGDHVALIGYTPEEISDPSSYLNEKGWHYLLNLDTRIYYFLGPGLSRDDIIIKNGINYYPRRFDVLSQIATYDTEEYLKSGKHSERNWRADDFDALKAKHKKYGLLGTGWGGFI